MVSLWMLLFKIVVFSEQNALILKDWSKICSIILSNIYLYCFLNLLPWKKWRTQISRFFTESASLLRFFLPKSLAGLSASDKINIHPTNEFRQQVICWRCHLQKQSSGGVLWKGVLIISAKLAGNHVFRNLCSFVKTRL